MTDEEYIDLSESFGIPQKYLKKSGLLNPQLLIITHKTGNKNIIL